MSIAYLILAIISAMTFIGAAESLSKIAAAWSYWMQQQIVRDELDGLNQSIEEARENIASLGACAWKTTNES